MLIDDLSLTIKAAFDEHSVSVTLDELVSAAVGTQSPRGQDARRWKSPVAALTAFLLIMAMGLVTLVLTNRPVDGDAVGRSTLPVVTQPQPLPTTGPTSTIGPPSTSSLPPQPDSVVYPDEPFVLLDAPRVIQGTSLGAKPAFDTDTLGQEAPLVPLTDLRLEQLALDALEHQLASQPIVALGDRDGLLAFLFQVVVADGTHTCTWGVGWSKWTSDPGGYPWALGDCVVADLAEPSDVAEPRIDIEHRAVNGPWVTQIFWPFLPPEVSVVQLHISDETSQWQRPIESTAVFIVETLNKSPLELVAYSENGEELQRHTVDIDVP